MADNDTQQKPWELYSKPSQGPSSQNQPKPWEMYAKGATSPSSNSQSGGNQGLTADWGNLYDFITSPHGMIRQGINQIGQAYQDLRGNGSLTDRLARAGHDVISGAMEAATPAMIPLAIANPVTAATGLIGSSIGGSALQSGARALGASPDVQNFAGDVGGLAGGGLALKGASSSPVFQAADAAVKAGIGALPGTAADMIGDIPVVRRMGKPFKAASEAFQNARSQGGATSAPNVGSSSPNASAPEPPGPESDTAQDARDQSAAAPNLRNDNATEPAVGSNTPQGGDRAAQQAPTGTPGQQLARSVGADWSKLSETERISLEHAAQAQANTAAQTAPKPATAPANGAQAPRVLTTVDEDGNVTGHTPQRDDLLNAGGKIPGVDPAYSGTAGGAGAPPAQAVRNNVSIEGQAQQAAHNYSLSNNVTVPQKAAMAQQIAQRMRDEALRSGTITPDQAVYDNPANQYVGQSNGIPVYQAPGASPNVAPVSPQAATQAMRGMSPQMQTGIANANYRAMQEGAPASTPGSFYEASGRAVKADKLASAMFKNAISSRDAMNMNPADWQSVARHVTGDKGATVSQATIMEAMFRLRQMEAQAGAFNRNGVQ